MPEVTCEGNILICTAGFGDGHNAAARGVAAALEAVSNGRARPQVIDLFSEGAPHLGAFLKWGYVFLTTHYPAGWRLLYNYADRMQPAHLGLDWLGGLHRRLSLHLARLRPAAVISTFPMYPPLLAHGHHGIAPPRFHGVVITDSITVNTVWLKAPCDRYFVTDDFSALKLRECGIPEQRVEVSGFAVSPDFARQAPRSLEAACAGPRVLYFATAAGKKVAATLEGLLRDLPGDCHLTVVTGRHERRLGALVRKTTARFPLRSLTLLGWCGEIPKLLAGHDLVISKGGGATVHECLAAGTPLVVNYVIPGQEEGNADLLQRLGCGWHLEEEAAMGRLVAELIRTGSWAEKKQNMLRQRRTDGALKIARTTLRQCGFGDFGETLPARQP